MPSPSSPPPSRSCRHCGAEGARCSPLSYLAAKEVARIFLRRARQAGISCIRFTGHSVRVGSAVELIEADASVTAVRFAGGWKGERMVLRYAQGAMAGRGAMAMLRDAQGAALGVKQPILREGED